MGVGRLFGVWAALVLLLAASMGATFLPIGPARGMVSLGIAVIKAGLVFWFFMRMRDESGLIRLVASAAVFMMAISFALTASDYLTRG